jgi:ABC-2 type transport system permease protein
MMGKILGIGAVGLTQLLIWAIVFNTLYFAAAFVIGPELEASSQAMTNGTEMAQFSQEDAQEMVQQVLSDLGQVNWARVSVSFIFYFFFGYILYASQFAAIGAAASDDGDVQTLMFPISIPIIISIVIMVSTIEQPNSSLAFWGSMIPLTSPVVMMSRVPFEIAWWEQILSMLILFGSSLGMVWVAGKVYRIGILIQGQKVSFAKIWKWMWA